MTIIERDVAFYEGQLEEYRALLRRCHPDKENGVRALIDYTQDVVIALKALACALPHNIAEWEC
jgi:hypothetical protein